MKRYRIAKLTMLGAALLLIALLLTGTGPSAAEETTGVRVEALPAPLSLPATPQRLAYEAPSIEPIAPTAGSWAYGPVTPFEWTRFDAVFVPGPTGEAWANKVYFPSGRTGTTPAHDNNIWSLDPLTGTYADTGHDVLVNTSNYIANLILDDGTMRGPAIYLVGGYNADAATNHGQVQRYYPQTGDVEVLPPADDFTGNISGIPIGSMGQAVVDDIIYVFGGWESSVAPYFYAGTWAFDPTQPSGSRWTDLGVVINPARAYIQTAVAGGKIYAMGGLDVWTGSELDPTAVVEVLDTADIASGWQTLTPMPVAGAEGQGFGNEAVVPDRLYVVGAADWPDGSVEAMEYNIGADSWNQAFPDLNELRRDHASAFVTLETPDPDDGLPGMWVFGGRWTGDVPPFAPTEFYPFEVAGACNVLVVDDDWDFESPNFGGRPYYTTALDDLGTAYTVWDTGSQGDPAAADMAPYDVVVWFTGYDWQTPITPTNEIELASYLDGGGNLLLSSQEYAYAAGGVTTFMADYLGVASVTEDVVELDPVGAAGNPVGDGLGPYTMVRPDDYDAYWPTDTYEGPYDDYVYADVSAQSPFYFSVSGEDSATNKDGGAFKTVYLGWPFEWIDTTAERAEILDAALDWMCVPSGEPEVRLLPPYQEGFANAGDIVPYDLSLTNLLGVEDTFDLTYTGNAWPSVGPSTVGPLADGVVEDFVVDVEIPPDAACLAEDIVTVTALDSTATYSDTALIRTVVGPAWQVEPSAELGAHWVASTCTDEFGAAGTCFYVGGIDAAGALSSAGQMFDIDTGAWTSFAQPVPVPVFGATLGYIDGKVYLAGGYTLLAGDWGGTYALQVYDLAAGTWSAGTPIPPQGPVTGAGGSNGDVLNGMLHVVGGCGANTCASNQHIAYDPVADAWTSLAPMPEGHVFFGAAAGNGRLYAGGDYFGSSSFLEYDEASDSWLSRASLPSGAGKKSPVAAVVPGGGVFWWGGDLGAWTGVQDTTWYWDPVADAWLEYTALLNTATTGAGGGMADGRLWNFAGSQGAGPILPPPHESLAFCIPPSPPAGRLEGIVYDANTNLPIEDAYVEVYREDPDYYASRHTAADGSWFVDPLVADTYTVAVAAFNYFSSDELPVTVMADTTTTLDVYLDASMPVMSETSVSMTLLPDTTAVHNLMLDNDGTGELTFAISEVPPGTYPTRRVPAMPEGIDPALLANFAASGDGTAPFIVYLADQADLTAAFTIRDWTERGQAVLNVLQATADRTQAGLRAELNRAGVPFESRIIVNALVVQGDLPLAQTILARPEVAYIGANASVEAPKPVTMSAAPDDVNAVEWNIDLVDADSVWTTFGATGAGIVVSNIDTGVLYTHPALVNQYRGNLGGSYDHNYNWWDPYGWSPTEPDDWHSHGSHTMGTMLGDDGGTNQIGMAPDAAWLACMGFDPVTGSGYTAELLECSEFILAPWDLTGANPDPAMRPHIVNNSWGGGQAQWWYNQAIYAWQAAGILPIFSIGNEGPSCETAGDPGDMANILAVGATDNLDSNAPGSPADFSSRGPAAVTGLIKPDVSAPGAGIRSAYNNGAYGLMGGTSMAAPHVAGEAALIWSAQPQLLGQVELTYWLITQNTRALVVDQGYFCGADDATTVPNNQYGWGRIDAFDAVDQAVATDWDIPWLGVDPTAGVVLSGAGATVEMTFDSAGMVAGECVTGALLMEFNDPYITETTMPVELCVEQAVAVLAINKTVTLAQDPVMPGDMITYTITIENSGNADAVDVHVVDLLPAGIDGTDLDTMVTVAAGATETIEIPALIEPGVGYETTILNVATYTFGEATGQASASFTTGPEPTGVGLSAFGGASGQIGWLAVLVAMMVVLAGFAWRRRAV